VRLLSLRKVYIHMKQTHIIFFSIIIAVIVIISAIGSFVLIKKGMNDLVTRPVLTTALTPEGEYLLVKQFNEKFKNSAERYADVGDVVSVKGRDVVVTLVSADTPSEQMVRMTADALIERLITNTSGQFRSNARVSDIKTGDRIIYYYIGKTEPIIVQAVQIVGNFSPL